MDVSKEKNTTMNKKNLATIWFSVSLLLICSEPTNFKLTALTIYLFVFINFILSALFVNRVFGSK